MAVIVTLTVAPVNPGPERATQQYVQATAEDYENARDDALARVP